MTAGAGVVPVPKRMLEVTESQKRLRTRTEHEYRNKRDHADYFIFGKPVDECGSLLC